MTMATTEFGTFYLPGPTEVRRATLHAMTKPMISHRSQDLGRCSLESRIGSRSYLRPGGRY